MNYPALNDLLTRLRSASAELSPAALQRLPNRCLTLEAVLQDCWRERFAQQLSPSSLKALQELYAKPEAAAALLLSLWLLKAPALSQSWATIGAEGLEIALLKTLPELLKALPPAQLFSEAERQEELIRFWLKALDVQLLNESPEASAERWDLISSQRRQELYALLRRRRKREQAVRQALARRPREESW